MKKEVIQQILNKAKKENLLVTIKTDIVSGRGINGVDYATFCQSIEWRGGGNRSPEHKFELQAFIVSLHDDYLEIKKFKGDGCGKTDSNIERKQLRELETVYVEYDRIVSIMTSRDTELNKSFAKLL